MSGLLDTIRARAAEIRDGAMRQVEEALRAAAPVGRTGRLRDEIDVTPFESGDVVGCEARSPTDYARFVDEGTPPHLITATRGHGILSDWSTGGTFFVRGRGGAPAQVHHPGTARTGFFTDTVRRWPEFLRAAQ